MPHTTSNRQEPLHYIYVYFVKTANGQWRSYGALAIFTKSPQKIVSILNNKYGHYRWVEPYKWLTRSNEGSWVIPSESTKFQTILRHLAGIDVEVNDEEIL